MEIRQILIVCMLQLLLTTNTWGEVRFAHITDLHIFEETKWEDEAKISTVDFSISINKINEISNQLKDMSKEPLAFVLLSGDIGVGKLIKTDTKTGGLVKDSQKWNQAVDSIAKIIKISQVKTWLVIPGNNDLYKEDPTSINFFRDFIEELHHKPEMKTANISIIDFRLEASQQIQPSSPPGTYIIGDFIFMGWDNSYFKNNNSVNHYQDNDARMIPISKTLEYKSVQKLSDRLKESKAKYAYLFYHIPDIDDPYLIHFDKFSHNNIVSKRLRDARKLSSRFANGLYPYSAWTVPLDVRRAWENTVTKSRKKGPLVKGLFAGHFHDHKKATYLSTLWLKTKKYKDEILNKLYLAPPVAVKNQTQYPLSQRATGGQIITINDKGGITREIFWFD